MIKSVIGILAIWYAVVAAIAHAGTLTLNSGTELHVVTDTNLSTKHAQPGQRFRARLVMPVFLNEREALPIGTTVEGTVENVIPAGRVSGRAEMQLKPDKLILPDGRDISFNASIEGGNTSTDSTIDTKEGTVKAGGKDPIDARQTAGGAVMGAGIGAVAAGGKGALIGAGAVGAVALLHQVFKKGKNAELPAGSELVLQLTRAISFSDMQEVPPGTDSEYSPPVK